MGLRERLHKLRLELVNRCSTTSFMIFKDEELEAIVKTKPKTLEQLSTIKGFPLKGKRVQAYGEAIIKCVNAQDDYVLVGKGEDIKTEMQKVEF